MAEKRITIKRIFHCYEHELSFYSEPISISPLTVTDIIAVLAANGHIDAIVSYAKLKSSIELSKESPHKEALKIIEKDPESWVQCVHRLTGNMAYEPIILTVSASVQKKMESESTVEFMKGPEKVLFNNAKMYLNHISVKLRRRFKPDPDRQRLKEIGKVRSNIAMISTF